MSESDEIDRIQHEMTTLAAKAREATSRLSQHRDQQLREAQHAVSRREQFVDRVERNKERIGRALRDQRRSQERQQRLDVANEVKDMRIAHEREQHLITALATAEASPNIDPAVVDILRQRLAAETGLDPTLLSEAIGVPPTRPRQVPTAEQLESVEKRDGAEAEAAATESAVTVAELIHAAHPEHPDHQSAVEVSTQPINRPDQNQLDFDLGNDVGADAATGMSTD